MSSDSNSTSYDPDNSPASSESSDLLFPTIAIDERVHNEMNNTAVPAMAEHIDTHTDELSNLGESTYEFVDTDTDSRDEDAAESIASTDLTGQDEVASLDGSGDSDEDSEHIAEVAVTAMSHETVSTPSDTPTAARSMALSADKADPTCLVAIEFDEPADLGAENVSVRHTIANLCDAQTERMKKQFAGLRATSIRRTATIRQTMTKHCLSTKEPLRILYVGSHAGRQDIIHKIGSSVAASIHDSSLAGLQKSPSSNLFNVIPVTAFGSDKPPEVELMHSSGIQISVEDCVGADNLENCDAPGRPYIIRLILEDNVSYRSVPNDNSFVVSPHWDLPHIGIFFCTENDSVEEQSTRSLANSFLARQKIPCIWISHKQALDRPTPGMFFNPHAIHICLESRDPADSSNVVHQRLPIDLASFLNIDARQMNRNIAYLTGRHEISLNAEAFEEDVVAKSTDVEKAVPDLGQGMQLPRRLARTEWQRVLPLVLLSLSMMLALLVQKGIVFTPSNSLIINGNETTTEPLIISHSNALSPLSQPGRELSTTTSTKTATRTITVTRSQSDAPNSISVLPTKDLGRLNEKIGPHASDKKSSAAGKSLCRAEIISRRELLLRIPTTTLTSWLGKDAISLNVSRGDALVETKRVYSTSDGIVLQFRRRDAFGCMNISIITGRKPKINETLQVDFGSNWHYHFEAVLEKTHALLKSRMAVLSNRIADLHAKQHDTMLRYANQTKEISKDLSLTTSPFKERAQEYLRNAMLFLKSENTALVQRLESGRTAVFAQLEEKLETMKAKQKMEMMLLKAQISSKLFWLKLQGKLDEHHDYEARAVAHTRKLKEEIDKAQWKVRELRQEKVRADRKAKSRNKSGYYGGKRSSL